MKTTKLLNSISACAIALGISHNVAATSWFDFSASTGFVTISATIFPDTTTLRTVSARCPAAGFLVAEGSAQFNLEPEGANGTATLGISITRDNAPPISADANNFNAITLDTLNGIAAIVPAAIYRVDSCTAGQTVTYRFVAWRENAAANSIAFQPKLVVEFNNVRI